MNFDAATIKEMINSIVEFLKEVIAAIKKAIVVTPGFENPDNYPDDFKPVVAE